MSAETSVVFALIFVGFFITATVIYSSVDYYRTIVKKAQYDQDSIIKSKMQTDITIINVANQTSSLNITIRNTGKTVLNASALHVFVNGYYYSYTLSSTGMLWAPRNGTNITIPVSALPGDRIKITTENGISDYALVP